MRRDAARPINVRKNWTDTQTDGWMDWWTDGRQTETLRFLLDAASAKIFTAPSSPQLLPRTFAVSIAVV